MKSVLNPFIPLCGLVMFFISISSFANEITVAEVNLTAHEVKLIKWVDDREAQILQELNEHVDINTGTHNIDGINQYREYSIYLWRGF